ncbi:50S ribosomal protein L11 methyltransferase, partial [Mesorhizobium sp. M7A.F.Ca.CA.004.04.2.1]
VLEVDEDKDIHEVSLYADGDVDAVETRLNDILAGLSLSKPIEREALPDIDWVAHSLEELKPVRAGRFFVHGAHDRRKRHSGEIAIEIEAGLAFGTGHHGTTAGCLEMLERVVRREHPRNALDLGTGSAVLAIAVAKLAHIPVLATDIDPVAVRVAAANARLNHVKALVETVTAPGFHHPVFGKRAPFDLIVANILARPLMRLAPQMAGHIALGGSIVLSGILDRQRDAVISAYVGQNFRHVRTLHREGWVTIHLKH